MSVYERDTSSGNLKKIAGDFSAPFVGATALADGVQGQLPTPLAGQQNATIMGSGVWSTMFFDMLSNFVNLSDGLGQAYTGDLDDIAEISCYNCNGDGGVTHAPETHWGFICTYIHCYSTAYRTQVWMTMPNGAYDPEVYIRSRTGSTWTAWKLLGGGSKSYIGMVIQSTTLDTEAKVIAQYGGTTWISHSGYMLRGAASGVVANSAAKDGGADTINISHNHQQGDLRAKIGCPSGDPTKICFVGTEAQDPNTGATQNCTYGTNTSGYISNRAFAHYTPVVGYTNTKLSSTQSVVPNYKNVYIWERTA